MLPSASMESMEITMEAPKSIEEFPAIVIKVVQYVITRMNLTIQVSSTKTSQGFSDL